MRVLSVASNGSLIALACCSLFAGPALAQQAVDVVLPEVVVSSDAPKRATGASGVTGKEAVVSPTAVVTSTEQIASSVTVLTAEELQKTQRRTVADALRTVPGLNVVQTGGTGGLTSVFMRGTNAEHVKVLVDGIDIGDASTPTGAPDIGHLMLADVARLEILRGPQSGLYGANTIGGVISIITKKGEGPLKLTGYVEGGSFGTFNQATGASGSTGNFNYAFNVAHTRSSEMPVTPSAFLGGLPRNNDLYDNLTYSTKLGVDVSKYLSLNVVARYTEATRLFTGGFAVPLDAVQTRSDVAQFFGRAEAVVTTFDGAFKNYFSIGHSNQSSDTLAPNLTFGSQSQRTKYDWRGVATLAPGQTLLMGLEHQDEAMNDGTVSPQEWNRAAYIELQSQFGKNVFLAANARYDDNETFGGHPTWRLAPSYIVPGTDTKLKASIGTGFKAPSLFQRFGFSPCNCGGFFPDFNGNPALQPEESLGYDFGFEQPLPGDKVRFGVTYFHNDIKNLIQTNATFTSYENIGQATTSGIEAFASFLITSRLQLRTDYTYTKAVDDSTGLDLVRRPRQKASVTASWAPTDLLTLSGTVLHVGPWLDRDRITFGLAEADGYTTVNLAAEYKLNETATLFGRVDNLFDAQYQDPLGYDRPGIGVFAGLRLTNR